MTDEGGQRFDKLIKTHLGTKKEEWKQTHTYTSERDKFDERHSGRALIGCGRLISTAQPLILPEDIGLIVELWMDELSSPTLLPPPCRELSQTGEGV